MLKKHLTILVPLAVVFFFVYSYLNLTPSISPCSDALVGIRGVSGGCPYSDASVGTGGEMRELIFNSPDEAAGYFFSRLFAETGRLSQIEPLDFLAPGLIHPRSVFVNSAGYLVPGGFLGLPLIFGSLLKIPLISPLTKGETGAGFGAAIIPFFTPFFAVLGVLAFYFLLRKIWDEDTSEVKIFHLRGGNVAFLSAVLMFFLPPYWYYSTRTMFPNVLFVSLLVISAAFFFVVPYKRINADNPDSVEGPRFHRDNADKRGKLLEYVRYCGGGLFLGLALITRTSEIIWLGILGLALAVYFYFCKTETKEKKAEVYPPTNSIEESPKNNSAKDEAVLRFLASKIEKFFNRIGGGAAILGFAALCAVFVPVLYQNQVLYGSVFSFGYNVSVLERNKVVPERSEMESKDGEVNSWTISGINLALQRGITLVLPFGIHPRAVWQNFWDYFIKFFWWFTIPTLLGCFLFFCQICWIFNDKIRHYFSNKTRGKSEIRNPKSETISNDQNTNNQNKLFRILKIKILNLFRASCFEFRIFNKTITKNQFIYFLSFVFVSGWLFVYYGSWRFSDNINFQKTTIGASYLRYWLPIFVMGLPFAALFLKKVAATFRLRTRGLKPAATIQAIVRQGSPQAFPKRTERESKGQRTGLTYLTIILFFMFSMSAIAVFAGEDEGVFYVKNNLLRYNEIKSKVLNLTEKDVKTSDVQNVRHPMFQGHRMSVQNQRTSDVDTNAIIITERSDKIFFPSRRVIIWKRGEALDDSFKKLSEFAPLYYYNIAFTDEEFRIMNQELSKSDLQLELVKVFGNEALYKIIFNF